MRHYFINFIGAVMAAFVAKITQAQGTISHAVALAASYY